MPITALSRAATDTLDAYAARTLACPPEIARSGGVQVLPVRERELPSWHGFTLPVVGLAFDAGAVVTCRPNLLEPLLAQMGSDQHLPRLDAAALRRLQRSIRRILPSAFTLAGDMRSTDAELFMPSPSMDRAELIPRDDPAALHLRSRFDGEVFGVRGPRERVISWAALKLKSDTVWELAVATDADYRGRGFARDVVSAATRFVLESGRIPLYVHDRDNSTSAFVARAVGYQIYAEIVLGEY